MSFYFSQLLATSGVRIGDTPPPERAPVPPVPDIVEVAGETVAELPPPSVPTRPPPTPVVERIEVERSSAESAASPPASHRDLPAPPPAVVLKKTAIIETLSPARTEPRATIQADESASAPARHATPTPAQPAAVRPETSGVAREEILQAVMNWIAAGQASPGEADPPAAVPAAVSEPRRAPSPTEPAIAERVIMQADAVPIPAPAPEVARLAAQHQPAESPAAPPVISIGAIHLRIEAPAPAPAPRSIAPARAPSPPPPRPDGRLKLRRHYVLPH